MKRVGIYLRVSTIGQAEKGIAFDRVDRSDWFDAKALVDEPAAHPRLLKLHGSLDCYRLEDGCIAKISDIRPRGPRKAGLTIQDLYFGPPKVGKIEYDRDQQLLFDLFRNEIHDAGAVIIIGTSLRGEEVANTLGQAAGTSDTILLCCGPKSEALIHEHFDAGGVIPASGHFPKNEMVNMVIVSIVGSR